MDEETFSTIGPQCPYCRHQHKADEPFFYSDYLDEMECDECGESFAVSNYQSWSWSCAPKQD